MAIEGTGVNLICALVEAFNALARPTAHFPDQFRAAAVGFVLERRNIFARLEEGQSTSDGRLRPVCVNDVSSTSNRCQFVNNAPMQEQCALRGLRESEIASLGHVWVLL